MSPIVGVVGGVLGKVGGFLGGPIAKALGAAFAGHDWTPLVLKGLIRFARSQTELAEAKARLTITDESDDIKAKFWSGLVTDAEAFLQRMETSPDLTKTVIMNPEDLAR